MSKLQVAQNHQLPKNRYRKANSFRKFGLSYMQLVRALYGKNWYNETFGQLVQFLSYLENAHVMMSMKRCHDQSWWVRKSWWVRVMMSTSHDEYETIKPGYETTEYEMTGVRNDHKPLNTERRYKTVSSSHISGFVWRLHVSKWWALWSVTELDSVELHKRGLEPKAYRNAFKMCF